MPPSEDRPFTRWEALGVVVSGFPWARIPWGRILTVLLASVATMGGGQVIEQRGDIKEAAAVAVVDSVTLGVLWQIQLEINALEAQVDSLKQGR